MNNEPVTNRTSNVSFVEMEALRDQLHGIFNNLNMIYLGLDSAGFSNQSSALEPTLLSLNDAYKKADSLMEKLMSGE